MTISALDLAALVASKLCHDIISPVGAIANGMEVLEEDKDPEMRQVALDLAKNSADLASTKLQFMRISFGAAGSAGAEFDLKEAEKLVRMMFAHERSELSWNIPVGYCNKDKVRLLLNLVLMANSTLPRGGTVRIDLEGDISNPGFLLVAEGVKPKLNESMMAFFAGDDCQVTAQNVHFYYARLLSDMIGMKVTISLDGERVTIHADKSS